MAYQNEIIKVLQQIDDHTPLSDLIKLLKQAVNIADCHNDKLQGYELRTLLIYRSVGTVYLNESITAFAWLLEEFDHNPEKYSEVIFYNIYKLMIDVSIRNSDISLPQVGSIINDYKLRLLDNGYSLRSHINVLILKAQSLSEIDEVKHLLVEREKYPFDALCENTANEYFTSIWYYMASKQLDVALAHEKQLFAAKDIYPELKFIYYCFIAYSLVRNKQYDQLPHYLNLAYANYLPLDKGAYLSLYISLLIYSYNYFDSEKAWQLFEEYAAWSAECDEYTQMCWGLYIMPLLKGDKMRAMQLPGHLPFYQASGQYNPADLFNYFHTTTGKLVNKFDTRNGNDTFSKQLKETEVYQSK